MSLRIFAGAAALACVSAASAAADPQVNAAGVTFDQAARHCFGLAEKYSSEAAASAEGYDGDSIGGAIGAGLSVGIERKRLRKRLYMKCMDANEFHKAKYVKFKREPKKAG